MKNFKLKTKISNAAAREGNRNVYRSEKAAATIF
jgi:hypothetical protein